MALQASVSSAPEAYTLEVLRARYEAYCAQQAAALPGLLPRGGVRALYRRARAQVSEPIEDPLALLVAHCRTLLALPPFDVWLEDYLRDRAPYLESLDVLGGPRREAPVMVEVRRLQHQGQGWLAGLLLFRGPSGWRGFISFHEEEGAPGSVEASAPRPRTGEIFREDSSEAIRVRFRSFSPATLQAFLRSALP